MNAYTKERLGITEKAPKGLWGKASDVYRLTGWSYNDMRKARNLNQIEWQKHKTLGFIYNLNTIPQQLVKQTA